MFVTVYFEIEGISASKHQLMLSSHYSVKINYND